MKNKDFDLNKSTRHRYSVCQNGHVIGSNHNRWMVYDWGRACSEITVLKTACKQNVANGERWSNQSKLWTRAQEGEKEEDVYLHLKEYNMKSIN